MGFFHPEETYFFCHKIYRTPTETSVIQHATTPIQEHKHAQRLARSPCRHLRQLLINSNPSIFPI